MKLFALLLLAAAVESMYAEAPPQVCSLKITLDKTVATAAQRKSAGNRAEPPITDTDNGFAWPDTPMGVVKTSSGYAFFGSDGAFHSRQTWQGRNYGNDRFGSMVRTLGTLDNPLGDGNPVDATLRPNPDPAVNPFYVHYDYIGGGPVYRVDDNRLLMIYHAEIPTHIGPGNDSFYSVLGLAASSDAGVIWTDLGEIVRENQAYRDNLDGVDIGDPTLAVSPDKQSFYVYYSDWLANGTTHWASTRTSVSLARASIQSVVAAAFGPQPHAILFTKSYNGTWGLQPALGGSASDLAPQLGGTQELQVAWNEAIHRYQMFLGLGDVIYYAESPDGLVWSNLSLLYDFRNQPDMPSVYVTPVGEGGDPSILGNEFYLFYTRYPNTGAGWGGATVHRFTIECQ